MSSRRLKILICSGLAVLFASVCIVAAPLRIVSYNVENLFHPKHDSIAIPNDSTNDSLWIEKDDREWTPEGERRWSYGRYYTKLHNIAKVLTHIGQWEGVDAIGLCEVENALVVRQLCKTIRGREYDFVHYESPDQRGIDVAFVYKKSRIDTIRTKAIQIHGLQTRDILYVCCRADKKDTLHFFICHMPSQRGGTAESEWKRELAKSILQHAVDSVLAQNEHARIVIMGDMNCAPADDLKGVKNRMTGFAKEGVGTYKWQGMWTCLDQFYSSASIEEVSHVFIYDAEMIQEEDKKFLGLKPKRTYNGWRYQKGFSDHLPIVMDIKM